MSRLLESLLGTRRQERAKAQREPSNRDTLLLETLSGGRPRKQSKLKVVVCGVLLVAVAVAVFIRVRPIAAPFARTVGKRIATLIGRGAPELNQPPLIRPPRPRQQPPATAPTNTTATAAQTTANTTNPVGAELARPPKVSPARGNEQAASRRNLAVVPKPSSGTKAGSARTVGTPIPSVPALPVSPVNTSSPSAEDQAFRLALYYHQTGEFEKALIQYKIVLERNELNVEAHNNLGLLYQGKGVHEEAIREFRKALVIDPKNAKAQNNLGVSLMQSGDVDAAAAVFKALVAADSRNVDAMVNLALAQRAANRPELARDTLLKALNNNPQNAAAHYNLALLYEDVKEVAKALDHYESYLKYASADQSRRMTEVRVHCEELRQRIM